MSRRHLAMLLALSAIWGASFLFIKEAVRELDPSIMLTVRFALAAATLAIVVLARTPAREAARAIRASARHVVVVGIVNSAIPFWLLFWAEKRLDSGLAAVVRATAPLFNALLALGFVRSERVGGLRLVGVAVGFGGVALLVGELPHGHVLGAVAVVGTALCYAAGGLYGARRLRGVPPEVTALGAMVAGLVVSLPFRLRHLPDAMPGWKATASLAALGVVGTGVAYLIFFSLLARVGAGRTILVTYLVPAAALLYGTTILGEPVRWYALAGLVLILGGVALGTGSPRAGGHRAAADSVPA